MDTDANEDIVNEIDREKDEIIKIIKIIEMENHKNKNRCSEYVTEDLIINTSDSIDKEVIECISYNIV
ncbi:hypothetical protein RCNV-85A-173 [Raccoonpox virus]|uniref:Uncharacterized protein n=1 Tax=Raccoon poxvirus TaxID=10256 RepID=A0A0G3G2S7_RACVI|nr:hypothetical protein ACG19_gp184 [Raccoonpox virus]AKJ93817.1 hypothetical protein RCNV-Herman-184 [Raccoonpox virus]AOP31450.1 hypothetical protein RCNV-85A-173 [Raccoonpox virus]